MYFPGKFEKINPENLRFFENPRKNPRPPLKTPEP